MALQFFLQKRNQIRKILNHIIGTNVCPWFLAVAVKPDCPKTCIVPAANIRGQAVTDHGRFFNAKIRDSGKTGVKERLGRLIGPDFLGNENALKIFADAGVIQTGILHRCRAVGGRYRRYLEDSSRKSCSASGIKACCLERRYSYRWHRSRPE